MAIVQFAAGHDAGEEAGDEAGFDGIEGWGGTGSGHHREARPPGRPT